jgi:hypothetical protein
LDEWLLVGFEAGKLVSWVLFDFLVLLDFLKKGFNCCVDESPKVVLLPEGVLGRAGLCTVVL